MLAMMQKYADTLESVVDERTAQLAQEKRTTEALLLRMLPKSVCLRLLMTKSCSRTFYHGIQRSTTNDCHQFVIVANAAIVYYFNINFIHHII